MTPWVLRLIVANVAMFFIASFSPQLYNMLVLVPAEILRYPWTPITYLFLHASGTHILFNMIGLFFFGPRVESRLGGKNFLGLYFAAGIGGALLSLVYPNVPIVGASGAIFGVTLAFARYWPRDQIYIWGILPIEARWLVIILTAMSLYGARNAGTGGGIAHFAHLGGFLGGYLYLRYIEFRSPARNFRARTSAAVPKRAVLRDHSKDLARWSQIPRDRMHEVNRDEVNRILDKISATGIASLTPSELETLERFSPKA
ncbi:MAG: rhomboid family intramembrane serine protease [Gemmatimonadota bacterium]